MDTFGIVLIIVFGILYFVTRKKPELKGWNQVSLLGAGVGLGIVIGAIWSFAIFQNIAAQYGG